MGGAIRKSKDRSRKRKSESSLSIDQNTEFIYDIIASDIDKNDVALRELVVNSKCIMIVNVASK